MSRIPPATVNQVVATPPASAPGIPPRPITPQVRRLIWLEPRVRRWWLFAVLVCIIFAGYAGDRLWARHVEARLIQTGTFLKAKIVAADNKINNMPIGPTDHMLLEIASTGEREDGFLSTSSAVGNDVMIHVDPADHSHWTDRDVPTPLLDSLLIGMLIVPLIPAVIGVGWVQARALQLTWEKGSAVPAAIFDRKQSPIAPMSYAIKCSFPSSRKKELFTVFVPRLKSGLNKGDLIWVISPPRKGRPVAALWMESKSA